MTPSTGFAPYFFFIMTGWLAVAIGGWFIAVGAPLWIKIAIVIAIIELGFLVWYLSRNFYRSCYIKKYISFHLRAYSWKNQDDGMERIPIIEGETISMSVKDNPAKFTPLISSPHEFIETGADVYWKISAGGLSFLDEYGKWKRMRHQQTFAMFRGIIDEPVHQTPKGPEGTIEINLPIGRYPIECRIEGVSKQGKSFDATRKFTVHIH